jgi:hypothetical protein
MAIMATALILVAIAIMALEESPLGSGWVGVDVEDTWNTEETGWDVVEAGRGAEVSDVEVELIDGELVVSENVVNELVVPGNVVNV